MHFMRKIKLVKGRIVITCLVLFISALFIVYLVARRNYDYPFKFDYKFNITSGLFPNTSGISLHVDTNSENHFPCLETITTPSFEICIYSRLVDEFISRDLENTGIWEPCITNTFQQILELEPDSIVIDIGANIGYYSLLAAKSGHYVVAIEPVLNHVERLYTAVHLNGVQVRVGVVRNGVADERGWATVRRSGHNQGDSQIEMGVEECQGSCPPTVKTILLNDLTYIISNLSFHLSNYPSHVININLLFKDTLNNNPSPGLLVHSSEGNLNIKDGSSSNIQASSTFPAVIIKLDIQGFEHKVFTNADYFFKFNRVSYIFMEWVSMREIYRSVHHLTKPPKDETYNKPAPTFYDEVLIERMLSFLYGQDFLPYSTTQGSFGRPLNPSQWPLWPHDILWVHRSRFHALRNIFEGGFLTSLFESSICV